MDLSPEHYKKNSSLQFGLAQDLLKMIEVKDHFSLLDVGCGDGKITNILASKVPRGKVYGIDSSPNMIDFAKQHYPCVEFIEMYAEDIQFKNKFNIVTCFSCLHWIKNPKKALENMAFSLVKGGELWILTYLQSAYSECLEKALELFPEFTALSSFRRTLPLVQYASYLELYGMTIEICQESDLIAYYPNKRSLMDYIKGWLISYVPLPEIYHETYLERVAEISQIYADSQHGFKIPYKTGILQAKK